MSDSTEDPMVVWLRERIAYLDVEIAERQAWRGEAERILAAATDGRSRINRTRRKGNAAAIEEVRGILSPTAIPIDGEQP